MRNVLVTMAPFKQQPVAVALVKLCRFLFLFVFLLAIFCWAFCWALEDSSKLHTSLKDVCSSDAVRLRWFLLFIQEFFWHLIRWVAIAIDSCVYMRERLIKRAKNQLMIRMTPNGCKLKRRSQGSRRVKSQEKERKRFYPIFLYPWPAWGVWKLN